MAVQQGALRTFTEDSGLVGAPTSHLMTFWSSSSRSCSDAVLGTAGTDMYVVQTHTCEQTLIHCNQKPTFN